jgi:hypothetical protein
MIIAKNERNKTCAIDGFATEPDMIVMKCIECCSLVFVPKGTDEDEVLCDDCKEAYE